VVEVADSGPGLGAEESERVFQRSTAPTSPVRARAEAPGLGLSIVAAVAEAHGGSVAAESGPGRGTTFYIMLPLLREGERHD
jgi:two-component system OmpR family sensor kinase